MPPKVDPFCMVGLATESSLELLKGSLTCSLSFSFCLSRSCCCSLPVSVTRRLGKQFAYQWSVLSSLGESCDRHGTTFPVTRLQTENRKLTAHCRSTWPYFGPTLLWASAVESADRWSGGGRSSDMLRPILCARPAEKTKNVNSKFS